MSAAGTVPLLGPGRLLEGLEDAQQRCRAVADGLPGERQDGMVATQPGRQPFGCDLVGPVLQPALGEVGLRRRELAVPGEGAQIAAPA